MWEMRLERSGPAGSDAKTPLLITVSVDVAGDCMAVNISCTPNLVDNLFFSRLMNNVIETAGLMKRLLEELETADVQLRESLEVLPW